MEPSQAQHESPDRAEENRDTGSLSRFRGLAAALFGMDAEAFKVARERDEAERRERRREKDRPSTDSLNRSNAREKSMDERDADCS